MKLLAHLQNVVVWDVIFLAEEVTRNRYVKRRDLRKRELRNHTIRSSEARKRELRNHTIRNIIKINKIK
jgi:hypothetical protein